MEKMNRFLEVFWMIMTIITSILVIYLMITESYEKVKWYVLIPLLTAAIWIVRRGLRKKFEQSRERETQTGKKKN